jgi:hypothetical protein
VNVDERLQCAIDGLIAIKDGSGLTGSNGAVRRAWYERYYPDASILKEDTDAEMSTTLRMINHVLEEIL